MKRNDFLFKDNTEPHRLRTREMIKKYPGIKKLIGKNQNTIYIILVCVSLQVGIAYLLRNQSWWVAFPVAWFFGAFVGHTLFVCIHEISHNLIFKSKNANTVAGIIANLPSIFPTSVSFQRYHLRHHTFQGVHELDADLPGYREARILGNSALGKATWMLLFPIFQVGRTFRLKEIRPIDKWVVINMLSQIIFTTVIVYFLGFTSLFYMFLSFMFSVGLHPLGGRWIQEHYLKDSEQETYSYYGPLNTIQFNIGYHNEHHDFPSIPWNNLPRLKKIAPDYYDTLESHKSWTRLFLRFIFDPKITLFSRIIRDKRGNLTVKDEAKPDAEIFKAQEQVAVVEAV
jgi:sphingolipid 4-desaturase/C4-monooxygenase